MTEASKAGCRANYAEVLIEGMSDPDTGQVEPGFNLPERACIRCGACVWVQDNKVSIDGICAAGLQASPIDESPQV